MNSKLWVLLWKELLDLARDRKTLIATVLLPMVSMPLLALTTSYFSGQQTSIVYLVDEDGSAGCLGSYCVNSTEISSKLVSLIEQNSPHGMKIEVHMSRREPHSGYDLMVVLLPGFTRNLTSLDEVAVVKIAKNIGSSKADQLYGISLSALSSLSEEFSKLKVEYLANASRLHVNPDAVLHPVMQLQVFVTPGGAPTGQKEAFRVWSARFLAFALAFIVMPPTVFITDSIAGERERKTLETLLVAPISRRLILTAKLVASSVLGLVAAMADVVGVIVFFMMLGAPMMLEPSLLAVHAGDVALTIFVTSALVIPIVSRADTARSAQAASSLITTLAIIIFFAMLAVDIYRLPLYMKAILYLIPYTHSALIVYNYVIGNDFMVIIHASVLLALSLILLMVSYKLFSTEAVIIGRPKGKPRRPRSTYITPQNVPTSSSAARK